jgi:MFS family permease
MRGNVVVIVGVAILFGLSLGIYDVVWPHWLHANGINYSQMGWIFALSNLAIIPIPILSGRVADLLGRKRVFAAGLGCCSAAYALSPVTSRLSGQMVIRLIQQASAAVYASLQGVLVFESSRSKFLWLIARAQGGEAIFTALGSATVLVLVSRQGTLGELSPPFYIAGGLLALAVLSVTVWLREPQRAQIPELNQRKFNPFDLPPTLLLLTAYNFVFLVGLSMSHSQMSLLFFYEKFELARRDTAWISIVHRLSLGVPMVLSTLWISRPSKWLFVGTVFLEGVFISATALPNNVRVAVALWFFHDALGASLWSPVNQWYMQHYARPEHRASNVATVLALSSLGSTVGPILAGRLARYGGPIPFPLSQAIELPFFASGVLVSLSAILVCLLPRIRQQAS